MKVPTETLIVKTLYPVANFFGFVPVAVGNDAKFDNTNIKLLNTGH